MKKQILTDSLFIFIIVLVGTFCFLYQEQLTEKEKEMREMEIKPDSISLSTLELTKENFLFACISLNIDSPQIVYAQAQLESAYFSSNLFKTQNNFLGLYNSRTKSYYSFDHWTSCLQAYRDFVQYKWNKNCSYYEFLENLPYAEDPNYIKKLKRLQ